jgi:N-acetylmuramoyl-L-alanine amidase
MRPQKIPGLAPVRAVLLDPGHGGHDRGAVNRYGAEKSYNLSIALEVQRLLREAGLRTELTRSTDRFIPLGSAHLTHTPENGFILEGSYHKDSNGNHPSFFQWNYKLHHK